MPLFETKEKDGLISIRLKVHLLVQQDIQDYGAFERSDEELAERARGHIAQMQTQLPTPETVLVDDVERFTSLMIEYYTVAYKGYLVVYTGLQEPFQLTVEPRYTTSAIFEHGERECDFTGRGGLLAIIKDAQDVLRRNAQEDECDPKEYLITRVQVTIYDAQEAHCAWYEEPQRFICYEVDGDQIGTMIERHNVSEEVLRGLGLPCTMLPPSEASDTHTTD